MTNDPLLAVMPTSLASIAVGGLITTADAAHAPVKSKSESTAFAALLGTLGQLTPLPAVQNIVQNVAATPASAPATVLLPVAAGPPATTQPASDLSTPPNDTVAAALPPVTGSTLALPPPGKAAPKPTGEGANTKKEARPANAADAASCVPPASPLVLAAVTMLPPARLAVLPEPVHSEQPTTANEAGPAQFGATAGASVAVAASVPGPETQNFDAAALTMGSAPAGADVQRTAHKGDAATGLEPIAAPSQAAANATGAATGPAAAKAPAGTAPASAAKQVAPVLVQLSHGNGGGHVTLRLNPAELGQVQVRIDRATDGSTSVQVTAERPETLQLLVADQAQLHRALDDAGVPQDGRTLSLSLARSDQGDSAAADSGNGGFGNGTSGGQPGNRQGRPSSSWGNSSETAAATGASATWLRAGVDITA